ncbi:hypothetical protein QOT17_018780 [Balamuthia mandrillaris]
MALHDNSTEFINSIIQTLKKLSVFEHHFISAYHPGANGDTESHIKLACNTFNKLVNNDYTHNSCLVIMPKAVKELCFHFHGKRAWSMASSLSVGRVIVVGKGVLKARGIVPLESGLLCVPTEEIIPDCSEILIGLPAYNPECNSDLEPFLWQLENNLQIVNLHSSMWNMALAKYTQGSKTTSNWVQNNIVIPCLSWHEARDLFTTHFSSTELQTHLHDEFFKLNYRPKEPVRKVVKRIVNILQQMTEQPSEAQKIAALKCCLNPCLLELVSNVLPLQNTEKNDQATSSSTSCSLRPTSRYSAAECKQIKQMKDSTQMPSKANTSQHHNGNNYKSSSSSSSSSLHPPSNKHTCSKHRHLHLSNRLRHHHYPHHHLLHWLRLPRTNQPSTNALDASAKQEFMEAVCHAWETQGNIEFAAINLNALLHPGNTFNTAMDAPSPAVTPEAIHVEGLNTDDDDIEDDSEEPPIMAPILLNHQRATAFIDSGAFHSFISSAAAEKYLHPASCERHHTVISHIDDMKITLGNRSTTHVTRRVAHICIDCGSCKLHHHFFIMLLQGEHEILFGKDIMQHISIGLFGLPMHYPLPSK